MQNFSKNIPRLILSDKYTNMIIGVTGTLGAGKDTVAEYLEQKGFIHFSLSDAIREECDNQGLPKDRDTLTSLANKLRATEGYDVLAKRIIKKINIENRKKYIITSIRNPKEAEYLKNQDNFVFVAVDAPIELRYERIKNRQREGDEISFEKFRLQEEREMEGGEGKQNLAPLIKMADYTIINDGNIEQLKEKVDEFINSLLPFVKGD